MARNIIVFDNVKVVNRLSYLIGTLAILTLFLSIVLYVIHNRFKIDRITITGNVPHITSEQLSYIAKNRLRGTFFTLDIDRLQSEFSKIPWVKSVVVTRNFPDTITVYVTEYKAVARFGSEDLISPDGGVFSGADDSAILPIFNGRKEQISQFLEDYKLLQPFLTSESLGLTSLELDSSGLSKLYLSNNLEVVMCDIDIASNVDILRKYFDKINQLGSGINYINMCYHNAVAVRGLSRYKSAVESGVTVKAKINIKNNHQ